LNEIRSNFTVFLQYACAINDGEYVGICCPDGAFVHDFSHSERPRPVVPIFNQFTPKENPNKTEINSTISFQDVSTLIEKPIRRCGILRGKFSRIVGGKMSDKSAWYVLNYLLILNSSTKLTLMDFFLNFI